MRFPADTCKVQHDTCARVYQKKLCRYSTYCFRYSRLRALLFGSRPAGGLPRPARVPVEEPLTQFDPPQELGRPVVPATDVPLGKRLSGKGESGTFMPRINARQVLCGVKKRTFAPGRTATAFFFMTLKIVFLGRSSGMRLENSKFRRRGGGLEWLVELF